MAMIFDLELPHDDVRAIAGFMASEGEAEIPELGEEGTKVLDALTGRPHPTWHTVVGNFVEFTPVPAGTGYYDAEGGFVKGANVLMDEEGNSTGRHGTVVSDYENPAAIYVVGVPC